MESSSAKTNLALLILRLAFGGFMLISHGWGKFIAFSDISSSFPDPLGVGSMTSLGLAVFAELFCAALIALGLFTRLATVPLIITMVVAFFIIHGADPFAKKEMAALYLCGYVSIFLTGGGDFSVQKMLKISANSRIAPLNWLLK